VVALYDYQAQHDDELSFVVHDVINVVDRSDGDWWRGQLRGQTGLFPSNYVAAAAVKHQRVISDLAPASAFQRTCLALSVSSA